MNSDETVKKLTDYYKGQYSGERLEQLRKFIDNVPEPDRDALYQAITEERAANTAITVADVKEACHRVGISYRRQEYISDRKVECDACGETYKYAPSPTDESREQYGIHDRCPNCGFQYGWTKLMREYTDIGMYPEWYDRYISQFQKNEYGTGKKNGRWYNKSRDDQYVARRDKELLDQKVARIRKSMAVPADRLDSIAGAL